MPEQHPRWPCDAAEDLTRALFAISRHLTWAHVQVALAMPLNTFALATSLGVRAHQLYNPTTNYFGTTIPIDCREPDHRHLLLGLHGRN